MSIKKNQIVVMNYEAKINDEVIDSNLDDKPIEFVYGLGQIVPGLESKIEDFEIGKLYNVKVPAIDAYGEYDESLTQTLPINDFEGIDLEIGLVLEGEEENKEVVKATVIDVTKENVTLDYNHPLAGCEIDFKVIIKAIV
eukprot:TRINITY_DN22570_c0_g1_i4.p2 TRINITY_DN22570_c0_g1~~TRINITY_DN22570_c0_g1_i4.p2  ORF type:complete len:148 (+),score=34.02 TRINITY_DN22570_c0_g1_i4:27-446(+)